MVLHEEHRSGQQDYLYHQQDENLTFPKHTHYSYEIVFCLEGELLCEVEEKRYLLHKGDGLLIFPGSIHSYKTEQYSRSYLCIFSVDWVSSFYDRTKLCSFSNPLFHVAEEGNLALLRDESKSRYTKMSVLYRLCGLVYEQSTVSLVDASYFALTNSLSLLIQENFTKNITLKELAREMGYDYTYLSGFFNKTFGMDFSSYVNQYRIHYACQLLKNSRDSITEIALQSGFSTIRNFNRVFKEMMGMTPREYRITVL